MLDLDKLKKFVRKSYRDGYLSTTVHSGIAYQIQALRSKLNMSQSDFAVELGMKQSTVSRLENTEYGRVTVQTLLDIATSLNVALIIRFVDYPTFLGFASRMDETSLQPETIYETLSFQAAPSGKIAKIEVPISNHRIIIPPNSFQSRRPIYYKPVSAGEPLRGY